MPLESLRSRASRPSTRWLVLLMSLVLVLTVTAAARSQDAPRARDLGVPFPGTPGPLNAITDLDGVEVGHVTLIRGDGDLSIGQGPVRTGVTAVWPRGREDPAPVFAAWFALNGDGEMTGTTWVEDSGLMEGPLMITNTLSVGIVHHAVIRRGVQRSLDYTGPGYPPWLASLPVVAETWDGTLNDIMGQHVTEEHALEAMRSARGGAVPEGNVGGGTGMICHEFKGGIGTASRRIEVLGEPYTVGVLVQCNYGDRSRLRIAGVPVGAEIPDLVPEDADGEPIWAAAPRAAGQRLADAGSPVPTGRAEDEGDVGATPGATTNEVVAAGGAAARRGRHGVGGPIGEDQGSIIVLAATDAPLLPHQLKRVARRISLGLARNGSISGNGSGDIFMAVSTANRGPAEARDATVSPRMIPNQHLGAVFAATVQATEEAIVNAMVAADTMTGADGITVHALPHDRLREILARYNRLQE